jgi:hypothetical protein
LLNFSNLKRTFCRKKELNGAASGNGNGLADTTIDSTGVGDETDDLYDAALETSGAIEVKRESAEIQSSLPSGHQLLGGGGGQTGSSSGSLTGLSAHFIISFVFLNFVGVFRTSLLLLHWKHDLVDNRRGLAGF